MVSTTTRTLVVLLNVTICALPASAEKTLAAAWLSAQQETQFSHTDGLVAPFWSDWAQRDSLVLDGTGYSYTNRNHWDGPDDAVVVVKATG